MERQNATDNARTMINSKVAKVGKYFHADWAVYTIHL